MTGALRVALVGAGSIGASHAASMRELDLDLVAVASTPTSSRDDFAEKHRIPARFASLRELLAQVVPDLVVIATPNDTHADLAIQALAGGASVLAEIPLGMSEAEVAGVRTAAAAYPGAIIGVGHTLRFWQPYQLLRDFLREDPPLQLLLRSHQLRITNVDWQGNKRLWVDNLLWHHGTHLVDAALWLTGCTRPRVSALVDIGPGAPMFASALLQTDTAIAEVSLSYLSRRARSDLVAVTRRHTYEIDGATLYRDQELLFADEVGAVGRAAVTAQLADVAGAVRERRPPLVGIEEAAAAARVVTAMENARIGNAPRRGGAQ